MRSLRLALSNLPKVNDPNPTHALHPSAKYLHMFCALLSLKMRVIHTSVIWNAKVAPSFLGWLQSSTAASFSMSLMLFGGKFLFEPPTVILFYVLGKPVSAEYIFLIIMWKVKWFFKNMDHFLKKSLLICYNIASVSGFAFWPQCMWDISTLTGDWAHSPCLGRQNVLTTGPTRTSPKLSDRIRCKEYVLFKGHLIFFISSTIIWAPTVCQALCWCLSTSVYLSLIS